MLYEVITRGYINLGSDRDEIEQKDIDALIADMQKIPIELGEEIIHVLPQNFIVDSETGVMVFARTRPFQAWDSRA